MSIFDDPKFEAIASRLGMGKRDLRPLRRVPIGEARDMLRALKVRLSERYKQAAFDIHPDRNPGNPDAAEEFHLLTTVYRALKEVAVESPLKADSRSLMEILEEIERHKPKRANPAPPIVPTPAVRVDCDAVDALRYAMRYTGAGFSFTTEE